MSTQNKPAPPPFLFTIRAAADYLGMGVTSVRMAIYARKLPAKLNGNRYLIKRADLEAFAESLPGTTISGGR